MKKNEKIEKNKELSDIKDIKSGNLPHESKRTGSFTAGMPDESRRVLTCSFA